MNTDLYAISLNGIVLLINDENTYKIYDQTYFNMKIFLIEAYVI